MVPLSNVLLFSENSKNLPSNFSYMNPTTQFLYTLDNLSEYSISFLQVGIVLVAGMIAMFFLRFSLHYVSGALLVRRDRKVIEEKKQVLGDLILMKEIQTELEKEIEQASLKATFQG